MALKLEKILESMDSFKLNSEVALLENEGLTDLTRAQTRKELHESFNFIKEELTKGGLLEETQTLLANAWTQAIMEDIEMPSVDDVKDFGNKVAGGAQYAGHGIVSGAGLISGATQGGNLGKIDYSEIPGGLANLAKQGYNEGYQANMPDLSTSYKMGEFVGENPGTSAAIAVGAPLAALAGAAKMGQTVRRLSTKRLPAPQA